MKLEMNPDESGSRFLPDLVCFCLLRQLNVVFLIRSKLQCFTKKGHLSIFSNSIKKNAIFQFALSHFCTLQQTSSHHQQFVSTLALEGQNFEKSSGLLLQNGSSWSWSRWVVSKRLIALSLRSVNEQFITQISKINPGLIQDY